MANLNRYIFNDVKIVGFHDLKIKKIFLLARFFNFWMKI